MNMAAMIRELLNLIVMSLLMEFSKLFTFANGTTSNVIFARSIEDFENPHYDAIKCGRNGKASYICDPDQLITQKEGDFLDARIRDIYEATCCPCGYKESGFLITLALMNKIELRNISATNDNKSDDHGRHLNGLLMEAKILAMALLKKWNLGNCSESVVIVFSRTDNVLYTVADSLVGKKLTEDLIGEITMDVRSELGQNLTAGLAKLMKEYKSVFDDSYIRKTKLYDPSAQPVAGASVNLRVVYICFYTFVTVIVTCLLQL